MDRREREDEKIARKLNCMRWQPAHCQGWAGFVCLFCFVYLFRVQLFFFFFFEELKMTVIWTSIPQYVSVDCGVCQSSDGEVRTQGTKRSLSNRGKLQKVAAGCEPLTVTKSYKDALTAGLSIRPKMWVTSPPDKTLCHRLLDLMSSTHTRQRVSESTSLDFSSELKRDRFLPFVPVCFTYSMCLTIMPHECGHHAVHVFGK